MLITKTRFEIRNSSKYRMIQSKIKEQCDYSAYQSSVHRLKKKICRYFN